MVVQKYGASFERGAAIGRALGVKQALFMQ
jgi:hypothetical protein